MDVSKMNVMCWFKVLLACFALAVSGCGSTDSSDTVEEDAKEDSSDETEDIGQDDGEEEPLEASGEEKSEEMEEKELGFLEKIAQEEGVCFADVDVKSVDVYAPFLQFEEGAVIESDAIKVDVTPVGSVLKLSDNFVVSDFKKAEEGDSWVSEQVSEGAKADSVEYVEYTFQGKIKGSFKYHDKIFHHETLNNAEAQHHLMFYEVLKTYFDKYGYFKLSFNGDTYVATQAGHLYTFEFTNFKQILDDTAKDKMAEEDKMTEESEASEGMEGEESEESEESSEKSEKSPVYFEADVVAKYSYNELAENAVQMKSAEACAAAEAEKEEAAEGEEGEASFEDSMMEAEAGEEEGQETEAAAEETAGEAAAATTDEASEESAEKEKEGAEVEMKEESSEAEASTASEGSSSEGEGETKEAAEASEGSAGEEKAAE